MKLVDALVKEYLTAGEKIEVYRKELADESITEDLRKELRSILAYLISQRRFVGKALVANGFDIEHLLLKRAAEEAISKTHRAGIASTHGDDGGIYRLHPDGRKEYIDSHE